ncbi:MAG TPA: hypothetical protein VFJ58_27770 [Armatimonadota bacterium]|nr:hypothetical protein [Armatimonadota bacterium]
MIRNNNTLAGPGAMLALLSFSLLAAPAPARPAPSALDSLSFGVPASEQSHELTAVQSDIVSGGLGEPARRLLPLEPVSWEGGKVAFVMKVDPDKPTYFTIRLWGSDISQDRLILLCEGKQIGYRHLGDIDLLDTGTDQPAYNGRFYYTTTPLPAAMTRGKTELHFEIRSNGWVWGYGSNWAQYQKPMTAPTRGIYRVYTHTDGTFVPPADETQGAVPTNPPVRQAPGPEAMNALKSRVNHEIDGLLTTPHPLNQMQMDFLARAYRVDWTDAYHKPQVISQVTRGLDQLFAGYRKDPRLMRQDPSTPNPGWFGFGPAGDAIWLLSTQLKLSLDSTIDDGTGAKTMRRAAWAEMLRASCDWNSRHRRQYTNQSMIVDLNIQLANRGLESIDPALALPQEQTLQYLYQSVGLAPWLGSETGHGPDRSLGDNYRQLTDKGLTRELGYVGYYGEVLDWVTMVYDSTRPAPGQPGDAKIRDQLVKIARARAIFRYPMLDSDGNRAMRIEAVVGWRDEEHYPGDVAYAERPTWDASSLYAAAATLDPHLLGYVQQMFADGQFFNSVEQQTNQSHSLRVTAGLLDTPDEYKLIQAQPPSPDRLPMAPGQPDFAWADEQDGVVAVKHGDEIFYASLYWRARSAINFLARVHDTLPAYDRIAVVNEEEQFVPSGMTFTRPDWTNFGFANGGIPYPDGVHSAYAGEQLPIAKIPAGIPFKPGDESPYAGRARFYRLRYGDYLIGMNASKNKTYELRGPAGARSAPELISGKTIRLNGSVKVSPMSTVVLYLGE